MFRRFRVWMIAAVLAAGLTGLLRADTSRNIPVTTAPGLTDITLSLAGTGVIKNQIFWNTSGAPSTCTIQVDSSADSITWTAGGAVGAQTCTSSGASAVVTGTFNYIRTVITMTGSGSVVSIWSGYGTGGGGGGGGGSITLQVNGVNNASQSQLNQTNTPTFNFVDLGTGSVTGAVNQTANYTWTGTHNFGNSAYFKGPSPWLSFKGFGAAGDGVTDDTAAIQSALTAAAGFQSGSPSGLGVDLFCDPGVYNITKPLFHTAKVLGIVGPGSVNDNQASSGCVIRAVGNSGWQWTNSTITSASVTSGTAGCPGSDQCTLVTVTTATNCCGTGQSIQVPMDVQVEGTDQSPSGGSVAVRSAYEGYHQVVATPASNQYQYFIGFSNANGVASATSVGTTRVMMWTAGSTTPYTGPSNIGSLSTRNLNLLDCTSSTTTPNTCPVSTANATTFTGISLTTVNGQVLTGFSGLAVNGYVGADAAIGGESHQITSNTATTVTTAQSFVNLCDAGILSVTRATNVVTAATYYTSVVCNVGDSVVVSAVPVGTNTFNGTFTITGITGSLLTWSQTGANESAVGGLLAKAYTGVKLFNARQTAGGLALNNANFGEHYNFGGANFERGTAMLLAGMPPTFAANKTSIGNSQGVWVQWVNIHHPSIWNSRYGIVTSENLSAITLDSGIIQCNSGNTPGDYSAGVDWGGLSPNFHGGENYIWGTHFNSCALDIGIFSNGINEIHAKTENDGNLSNYTVLDYPLAAGGVVYTSGATVTGFSGLPPNGLRRFPLVLYRSGTVSTTMGNPVINLVTTTPAGTAFDIGMTGNKIVINDGGGDHVYTVLTYNSPTQLTLNANAGSTSVGTLYTYYDFNDTYTVQANTATTVTLATTPTLTAGNYGAKIPSVGVVLDGDPTYGLTGDPQTTISRRNKLDVNAVAPGLGVFVGPNASDTKLAQSVSGCSDLLICAARQIAPAQLNTTEITGDASGTPNQVANYQPDNDMIQTLNVGALVLGTGANNAGALNLVYPFTIPVVAATPGVNHTDAAGNTYTDTSTGVNIPSGLSGTALQRTYSSGNCITSFTVTTGVFGTLPCYSTLAFYEGPQNSFTLSASEQTLACFGTASGCATIPTMPSMTASTCIKATVRFWYPTGGALADNKTMRWEWWDGISATHYYATYAITSGASSTSVGIQHAETTVCNSNSTTSQFLTADVLNTGLGFVSIPQANNLVNATTLNDWATHTNLSIYFEVISDMSGGSFSAVKLVDFKVELIK